MTSTFHSKAAQNPPSTVVGARPIDRGRNASTVAQRTGPALWLRSVRDSLSEKRLTANFKRYAATALSLAMITACNKGPTAPSILGSEIAADASQQESEPNPSISAPETVRVREVDSTSLHVDILTSTGEVSVLISKPSEGAVGTAIVDGVPVCLPGATDCHGDPPALDGNGGKIRPQIAIAPIVVWAIRAYATWDFLRGCAQPAWRDLRAGSVTQSTLDNCVIAGASEAAGGVLGGYLRGVGVTRLRGAIKDGIGRRITWQQLRTAVHKRNFRNVVEIVTGLAEEFFQRVYDGIYDAMQRL